MQRILLLAAASLTMLVQSTFSFASGGGGYSGGGGGGFGGGGGGGFSQQRQVDQTYEVGKSIFNGRAKGEPSLEYCVDVEGERLPVKRKSVKSYKKGTYNDFANNLYRCDEPETLIAESLTRDSLLYVIYYLNKRHKLNLKGA